MTAIEAYLRLDSYKIVSLSHQIYTLSVHDEMGHTRVIIFGFTIFNLNSKVESQAHADQTLDTSCGRSSKSDAVRPRLHRVA
jgi:hypothetical protein